MRYDDFIRRVRRRADLDTDEEAITVTKAVLATLGECLYRTERDKLTSELPRELTDALYAEQPRENRRQDTERFRLEEFFNRVRARGDIGGRQTEKCTMAVLAVLREAVASGTMAEVMKELPGEYDALLQTGT